MSAPGSLPSSICEEVTSMMSSDSWKAMPIDSPKASRVSSWSSGVSDSNPPSPQERDRVVPARVRAGDTAPVLGLVDHVVVVQGGQMGELDRDGSGDQARIG